MHGDSKDWLVGGLLLALLGSGGCGKDKESDSGLPDDEPRAGASGASATPTGGSGAATGGVGGSAGAGASGNAGGAGGAVPAPTFPVGSLGPLAAPSTSGVPEPSASVSEPNLRVLPWAGFTAALSYTFDDTQPSQREHWDALAAMGVPLTFFANPSANWQAGYDATWTAVAAAGSEIGNHTWSHCHANLSDCTPVGTAEQEIDDATAYIIEHLGVPAVLSFAAPFGDATWNQYAAPRFLVGRGVMSGFVAPTGASNWHNLPCIPVAEGQTVDDFNAAIDNAQTQGRWGIFMFHSILPTTNNWYAGVEMTDIAASVAYAQGLGDVWIERMGVVGAYARAQQMFEGVTPSDHVWTWTLPDRYPAGGVLRVTVDGGTLTQGGTELTWDPHGYYEVDLDAGQLAWSP